MRSMLLVFAACLTASTAAMAQTIGAYRDASAIECPVIPMFMPTNVYVVATLEPAACGGITGAEFRLEGWPTGWFYTLQLGPGVPVIGDPFGDGIRIPFGCQSPESSTVVVMTVVVFSFSAVTNHPVTVAAHRNPSDPQFPCPVLRLCDSPVFSSVCATGVPTSINSTIGFCPCQGACYSACPPVDADVHSWSGIKRLYQ